MSANALSDQELTDARIDAAVQEIWDCKLAEDAARQQRIKQEQKLIELLGCPDEGSVKHKREFANITITQPMYRKVTDAAPLDGLPDLIRERLVSYTAKVSEREYKALRDTNPDLFNVAAMAIESKPGKPSVKIEVAK